MKLYEIAKQGKIVSEGQVEPNVMMSVQNVVNRGFANNVFEFLVITRLLQLIKIGDFYKTSNPIFDGNISTSKEIMDHLKALPHDQLKGIATKLWNLLQIKDQDALSHLANPDQETTAWLTLFHTKEANE